jgi:hypothetical protein
MQLDSGCMISARSLRGVDFRTDGAAICTLQCAIMKVRCVCLCSERDVAIVRQLEWGAQGWMVMTENLARAVRLV